MVALALLVAYPLVGRWMIRTRVQAALAARFGSASIADIDVELGHAVLTDVRLGDPASGLQLAIARVDVDISTWRSLVGSVHVEEVRLHGVTARVDDRGHARARAAGGGRRGRRLPRPDRVVVDGLAIELVAPAGLGVVRLAVEHAAVTADGAGLARGLTVTEDELAARLTLPAVIRDAAGTVRWQGGTMTAGLVDLIGVGGELRRGDDGRTVVSGEAVPRVAGRASAGAPWRWRGALDRLTAGELTLTSARADGAPAALRVTLDREGVGFDGELGLPAVAVEHPAVAEQPFPAGPFDVRARGRYQRRARVLELPVLTLTSAGVAVEASGTFALAGGREPSGARRAHPRLDARVLVPPTPCQRVLAAIPAGLVPALAGYQLAGTFALEVHAAIDGAALGATTIDGAGGLGGCQVVSAPPTSPTMLTGGFTLRREIAPGQWRELVVSPREKDYVRYDDISSFVVDSLTETEDPNFLTHDGIDARGLRRALVANLEAGSFRIGSSTITMQLAKNVFLHGRKTLSRKLQELVLAWHIEQLLSKPKILELYLNVIEFGPGVYGVGPAAQHFFGKDAIELEPREAAFFSAIVPRPTWSYQAFCTRTLDELTREKVKRALSLLVYAGHITSDEWKEATAARLDFRRDDEAACLARRQQAFAVLRSGGSEP